MAYPIAGYAHIIEDLRVSCGCWWGAFLPVRVKICELCHHGFFLMDEKGGCGGRSVCLNHRLVRGSVFKLEEGTKFTRERAVFVPGAENEDVDGQQGSEKKKAHKQITIRP